MTSHKEEAPIPDTIVNNHTNQVYIKGKFFGKGGFARCYEIKDENGQSFAGKIVSKKLLVKSNQKEKMAQEIEIHRAVQHKHIVKFHGYFEDSNFVYVVLELCHKRSLMELHRRRKALTEPETRYYMKQLLEGVLYLHNEGIIHRDLKLGNLFLSENMQVKIGDFGLAARIEYEGQRKKTLCGTPNYIAPEILLKKGHSFEVDIWSIGCIMYTLLVGKPPFETDSLKETYNRIKKCDYRLPNSIKHEAATLIHQMLQPDPTQRPSVRTILDSPFFKYGYLPAALPPSSLTVAPRFDVLNEMDTPSRHFARKPLIERNCGDHNSPMVVLTPKKFNRKPMKGAGDSPAGHVPKVAENANNMGDYLRDLKRQIEKVLAKKPPVIPPETDDLTDPKAQPFVWVSKWVDYSDKYGFGYQLCDDGVGVMFNDNTRILLLPNQKNVHYIERDGLESYYILGNTPSTLDKKVKLLQYFRRYMKEHLMTAGASIPIQESDQLSRIPYLHMWHRSQSAVVMQLTNGTLQINFNDHTKAIMCPLMSAITYISNDQSFKTYRFSTIAENGCSTGVDKSLHYACNKIAELLANN